MTVHRYPLLRDKDRAADWHTLEDHLNVANH